MAALMKSLGIDGLSIEAQLQLLDEIWDSISQDAAPIPVSDELKELLDKRIAAYEANPDNVYTLEEVMETVRRDLAS